MTFKILTDSTSDLELSFTKAHEIQVLDLTVTVGNQVYTTFGEGSLKPDELLQMMQSGQSVQTSQINSGAFADTFKKYAEKSEDVLYIGFSSGLSGTFQSAVIGREMVLETFPDAKIILVDSLAAASGEGILVEQAVLLRDEGLQIDQVAMLIETLKMRVSSQFMVEDLNHLARGGRIPKAAALVGTMANIKPLLDVDAKGKLRQVSKVRGKKKAIKHLIDQTMSALDLQYPKIVIGYSGEIGTALEIKTQILENSSVQEVEIRPIGSTIVTHTGKNTLAIFSISQKVRK